MRSVMGFIVSILTLAFLGSVFPPTQPISYSKWTNKLLGTTSPQKKSVRHKRH
jgi:hypothetical protein